MRKAVIGVAVAMVEVVSEYITGSFTRWQPSGRNAMTNKKAIKVGMPSIKYPFPRR